MSLVSNMRRSQRKSRPEPEIWVHISIPRSALEDVVLAVTDRLGIVQEPKRRRGLEDSLIALEERFHKDLVEAHRLALEKGLD